MVSGFDYNFILNVCQKTLTCTKDDVKFRKTSAMVLMPTVTLTPTDFATDLKNSLNHRSLNVDTQLPEYKPMKTVSGLENGSAELPKLRSALKLSTVNAPKIETTESTSLDTNNNNNRRGSVGLGRSKSVCHKVKFEPPQLQVALPGMTSSKNEGKTQNLSLFLSLFYELYRSFFIVFTLMKVIVSIQVLR